MSCQTSNPAIAATGTVSFCTITHSQKEPLAINVGEVTSRSCNSQLIPFDGTGVTITPISAAQFVWLKVSRPVHVELNGSTDQLTVYTQLLVTAEVTSIKVINDIEGEAASEVYIELTMASGTPF